ncbi:MAG: DoxX family protein [Bacteroidota bacterium]
MKRLFNVGAASCTTDTVILIARVGIAALMLSHGLPKMMALLSSEPVQFMPVMGMSAEFSLALAVFAEVICSILILMGFATRLATIPLIITMLIAVFFVHLADPFAKMELALHYLLVYIILLITGSGKYSVDYLCCQKS